MSYSFNLIDESWIPCILSDGGRETLSLRATLLRARELRGIQGESPLETAALYRLLLAVLHSALRGPRTNAGWLSCWKRDHWEPELVNQYLERWSDRFDLFHPHKPFFQAVDARAKPKSVITLVMDMASGNNAALFDHHTEETGAALSPAQAARSLLVMQNFGLAGLWLNGVTFTDSPWSRGIIFLLEGDNLFQTLALNLLPYPDEDVRPSRASDAPAWEKEDPYQPARQIPEGYLDYLTWQSRRIQLIPEGDDRLPVVRRMTMAPGLRLDGAILDPMKNYRKNVEKEIWQSTRFLEDRSLWRDSASFLSLKSETGRAPQSFSWLLDRLDGAEEQKFRYMALGMANDQAKVEFFREEHLPLRVEYLSNEDLISNLRNALDLAEKARSALKVASQWMALLVISPKSDGMKRQEISKISKGQADQLAKQWSPDRFYWQRLEIPFLRLLENLPERPEALGEWKEIVFRAAWAALEQAASYAGTDASALKASVRARSKLGQELKALFPDRNLTEDEVPVNQTKMQQEATV